MNKYRVFLFVVVLFISVFSLSMTQVSAQEGHVDENGCFMPSPDKCGPVLRPDEAPHPQNQTAKVQLESSHPVFGAGELVANTSDNSGVAVYETEAGDVKFATVVGTGWAPPELQIFEIGSTMPVTVSLLPEGVEVQYSVYIAGIVQAWDGVVVAYNMGQSASYYVYVDLSLPDGPEMIWSEKVPSGTAVYSLAELEDGSVIGTTSTSEIVRMQFNSGVIQTSYIDTGVNSSGRDVPFAISDGGFAIIYVQNPTGELLGLFGADGTNISLHSHPLGSNYQTASVGYFGSSSAGTLVYQTGGNQPQTTQLELSGGVLQEIGVYTGYQIPSGTTIKVDTCSGAVYMSLHRGWSGISAFDVDAQGHIIGGSLEVLDGTYTGRAQANDLIVYDVYVYWSDNSDGVHRMPITPCLPDLTTQVGLSYDSFGDYAMSWTVNNIGLASSGSYTVEIEMGDPMLQIGTLPGNCSLSGTVLTCLYQDPIEPGGQIDIEIPVALTPGCYTVTGTVFTTTQELDVNNNVGSFDGCFETLAADVFVQLEGPTEVVTGAFTSNPAFQTLTFGLGGASNVVRTDYRLVVTATDSIGIPSGCSAESTGFVCTGTVDTASPLTVTFPLTVTAGTTATVDYLIESTVRGHEDPLPANNVGSTSVSCVDVGVCTVQDTVTVFVVDISGSTLPYWADLVAQMTKLMEQAPVGSLASLVVFTDTAQLLTPQPVTPAEFVSILEQIQVGGATDIGVGISTAVSTAQALRDSGHEVRIVLVTDGEGPYTWSPVKAFDMFAMVINENPSDTGLCLVASDCAYDGNPLNVFAHLSQFYVDSCEPTAVMFSEVKIGAPATSSLLVVVATILCFLTLFILIWSNSSQQLAVSTED